MYCIPTIMIIIMISIQWYYKFIFKYSQIQSTGILCYSDTNGLLTSDFSSSTQGERQFRKVFHNHTMLTPPPTFGTSRGVLDLNSSSPLQRLKTQLYSRELHSLPQWQELNCLPAWSNLNFNCLPQWQRTQVSAYMVQCQLSTESFSKSSKFSARLFWTWRYPHSSLISCLEFIMPIVIVISFARERKLYPMAMHLNS